jgi:hypothetical protein
VPAQYRLNFCLWLRATFKASSHDADG